MSEGTILQILVYLFSAGVTVGTVLWRIKELEKKVDKHNCLVDRMYKVEARLGIVEAVEEIREAKKE